MIKFKLVVLNKPKQNGKYLIYLRLTQKSKLKYISTNQECELKDWNANQSLIKKGAKDAENINYLIKEFESYWQNFYNELPIKERQIMPLTKFIDTFNNRHKVSKTINLFELITNKINTLISIDKIGSSKTFKDLKNSITNFINDTKKYSLNITLDEVDVKFLKDYELYLKKRGCNDGSISVRVRALRTIYNECIDAKLISADLYPFKVFKVSRLKSQKNIRAISEDDINKIINLDLSHNKQLDFSRDLFIFSYLMGGINFADLILLEKSNIHYDRLSYVRSKTKGLLNFKLTEKTKAIILKYEPETMPIKYLFPILRKNNMTALQISNRKAKMLRQFNKDLKEVAKLANLDASINITSYVARHSMASNLKLKGVATDVISEIMNHQTLKQTQTYLKRLENKTIDNALDLL